MKRADYKRPDTLVLYDDGHHKAIVNKNNGHCWVIRYGTVHGVTLTAPVGDKLPGVPWSKVELRGCPDETRKAILAAWAKLKEEVAKSKN